MAFRKFTEGITFFVSRQTRDTLDEISQERRITVSELLRKIIEEHLSKESKSTPESQTDNYLKNLISKEMEYNNE